MSMAKRTHALPSDLMDRFEQTVDSGKRSRVVADLIRDWLDEKDRGSLRRAVIDGCRELADIDIEIAEEWRPLEESVFRLPERAGGLRCHD